MDLSNAAIVLVVLCWFLFGVPMLVNHLRVRREPGRKKGPQAAPDIRAPKSLLGLLLEGLSLSMIFAGQRRFGGTPALVSVAAVLIALLSVGLASWAIRHLGRQWRIKAVVTHDHELVTTGPYSLVRHPIYLALMGMAIATALVLTRWEVALAALVVYIAGTEIRIRAEDGILRRRFGPAFDAYKQRVAAAYIPFLR
jgi:protein-S-isoprenylcysteine O-methyltransferase Ste14